MRAWDGGRVGLITALLGTALACGASGDASEDQGGAGSGGPNVRALPEDVGRGAGNTLRFFAQADAHVQEAQPTANSGSAQVLEVDGAPRSETYLRFTLAGLARPVVSAKLRLFSTNPSSHGPAVYAAAPAWNENSVTWASRPSRQGAVVVTAGAVPVNAWVELDVTPLVQGNGTVSLALIPTGTDGADFRSREAADRKPELVVTLEAGSAPFPGETRTLGAAADAYTDSTQQYVNFNTGELRVDEAPSQMKGFLRFDLSELTGDVVSARLRLFVLKGSSNGPAVWTTSVDWDETFIQAASEPYVESGPVANAGAIPEGQWLELDVTGAFLGGRVLSFGLLPESTDGAAFASREHPNAALRPQLVVKTARVSCTPPPGDSPASGTFRGGQSWGGTGYQSATGVATGAQGERVVIADYDGSVDFGGGALPNHGTGDISDNDIALVKLGADGSHLWSKGFGAPGSWVNAMDVAVNATGHIAVVGRSSAGVELGGGLISAGGFVAKFSPEGSLVWAHSVPGYPQNVVIDSEGRVFAVGEAGEAPSQEIFVLKFEATGSQVWDKRFTATGQMRGSAIAVGPAGELAVGGTYWGTVTFGSTVLPEGVAVPFLLKLLPSGQVAWGRGLPADSAPYAERGFLDLAVAPDGAIAGVGSFSQWIRLGSAPGYSSGMYSGFLLVVEPDGSDRWWRWMGNEYMTFTRGVAIDPAGDVVVMGTFRGTLDLGGGSLSTLSDANGSFEGLFVAKYRLACGEHRWSRQLSDGGYVWTRGLSVAPDRSISLTGQYVHGFGDGFPEDGDGSNRAALIHFSP
ncbi:DNRLRE domain-containing protein [Stigmatella sp. ncwal1]|uniref:DNRLRE domain-containing protein n=1 Tax=Stigmatella ashevillensis TaxID=2995309 RepID=A0ABT5D5P8_9BACT|nr:DNRLRE domain-containing protein [Stigmatella ashevillena]MDC0708410.1 DNRLRE domain-containing protein [Stigmatella ashevillena]